MTFPVNSKLRCRKVQTKIHFNNSVPHRHHLPIFPSNIQPPSESIVVDRNILLSARVNFKINIGPNVPVGTNVWQYGQREAFQAFPLNNLFSTATATVNKQQICQYREISFKSDL